jgi:hypothetical protein
MKNEKNLNTLYSTIRQKHPSVAVVDETIINSFQKELEQRETWSSAGYIVVTLNAIFFLGSFPILVAYGYRFVRALPLNSLEQKQLLNSHLEVMAASLFLVIGTICYTFFPPAFARRTKIVFDFKRSDPRFLSYALTLNYIIGWLLLVLVTSYRVIPQSIINTLTIVWLMIPVLILSCLPTLVLLFAMTLLVLLPGMRQRSAKRSGPAFIVFELLQLLQQLNDVGGSSVVGVEQKKELTDRVSTIAFKIGTMYTPLESDIGTGRWAMQEMRRASRSFLALNSWIYFPQSSTFADLQYKVCLYLNVFLTGHYHELPREDGEYADIILAKQISRRRKLIDLLVFTAYMVLPVIGFAGVVFFFRLDLPAVIQSALGLLYIIWCVVGFFTLAERFAPEAKAFMMEIMKSLVQRK